MKGDFSRFPYRRSAHYESVLLQQGRVSVDADWNEQAVASSSMMRQLIVDLIGWHGAPTSRSGGFEVSASDGTITVGGGTYYVDGIRCSTATPVEIELPNDDRYLAYLEVWEHQAGVVEDPSLLDPALGGGDTSVRVEVAHRVYVVPVESNEMEPKAARTRREFRRTLRRLGVIRARSEMPALEVGSGDGPGVDPQGGYAGSENHLYRIEVHQGSADGGATFKWSRSNGSEAWRITEVSGVTVSLSVGRTTPASGDWVEVEGRDGDSSAHFSRVEQVAAAGAALEVTLSDPPSERVAADAVVLRSWDGPLQQAASDVWIDIEHGLRIRFNDGSLRSGDYWVIAARAGSGIIDWPHGCAVPPLGVERHHAPLAVIEPGGRVRDLRRRFAPLSSA